MGLVLLVNTTRALEAVSGNLNAAIDRLLG